MNDPTMMLIFDLVKPKPNQLIISPKCMYSENVVQFHLEVFVDSASWQFAAHSTRRSHELFDHLLSTDDCRAILPPSSLTKIGVSSQLFHNALAKATMTRCIQMSDMSAPLFR